MVRRGGLGLDRAKFSQIRPGAPRTNLVWLIPFRYESPIKLPYEKPLTIRNEIIITVYGISNNIVIVNFNIYFKSASRR